MLTPWHILAIASLLLLLMYVIDRGVTRRRNRHLRQLAVDLRMRYSAVDRFRIAPRLALTVPMSGAADVRVRDLMYRLSESSGAASGEGGYVYVFTIEYATGTIAGVTRRHVVGRVIEPVGRSCEQFDRVDLADQTQPLDEQYRSLLSQPEPPLVLTTPETTSSQPLTGSPPSAT